jgi:hypothetical protein
VDGLRFGKFQMEVREEGSQSRGFLPEAFGGDAVEHPPAVAFQESKDLISGLMGVLSAGLIFDQKV